ncbi:allergen [Colletotrichum asianum]
MDKAKSAVSNFMSGDGHHKTTVTQDASQAITEEQVRPHQHENVTTAVDKEVHQDHHHTHIQPIKHKETLPEQHHHNMIPTQHKTFNHGNESETRDTLDREAAKFKNTSTTHETTHTSHTAPVVTGERVHHHVHEHIQPVIQKETIQPHVVHTTVPIHETHHAKPIHHGATTLPAMTIDEFNKGKDKLTGTNKMKEFDGCPDKHNKIYESTEHTGLASHHNKHGHDHHHLGHHNDHHNGGKVATAGAAAAAGGAAAHHHHNKEEKRDATHPDGLREHGLAGREGHHEHNSHNKTTAAAGAAAAAGAGAAAHKHHNNKVDNTTTGTHGINNTITGSNTTSLPNRGVGQGQGFENQRASDSVTAAQTANSRTNNGLTNNGNGLTGNGTTRDSRLSNNGLSKDAGTHERDNIAHGHTTGSGKNSGTNTVQSIMHGTHTSTGNDSNYTTGNGSGLNGTSSLNKNEPRAGDHHSHTTDASSEKKVSLVDKLNPFKDADGDGHRGIMS